MHGWRLNQAAVKYEQLCESDQEGDVCKLVAQMIAQKAKKEQYPRNFDQKIRSLAKGEYDTLSRKMTYAKSRSKKEEDKQTLQELWERIKSCLPQFDGRSKVGSQRDAANQNQAKWNQNAGKGAADEINAMIDGANSERHFH